MRWSLKIAVSVWEPPCTAKVCRFWFYTLKPEPNMIQHGRLGPISTPRHPTWPSGGFPLGPWVDSHPSEANWFPHSILKDWRNYQLKEYEWPVTTNVPIYLDPGGINMWQLWFSALVHYIVPPQEGGFVLPLQIFRASTCACPQATTGHVPSLVETIIPGTPYFLGQNYQSVFVQIINPANLGENVFDPDCWRRRQLNWSTDRNTGVGPIESKSTIIPGIVEMFDHRWVNQGNDDHQSIHPVGSDHSEPIPRIPKCSVSCYLRSLPLPPDRSQSPNGIQQQMHKKPWWLANVPRDHPQWGQDSNPSDPVDQLKARVKKGHYTPNASINFVKSRGTTSGCFNG